MAYLERLKGDRHAGYHYCLLCHPHEHGPEIEEEDGLTDYRDAIGRTVTFCEAHAAEYSASPERTIFVNVYLIDRAYGGPEEGGWWYDCGQIIAVYPCDTKEAASKLKDWLEKGRYSNEGRRDIGSVLSEGIFNVVLAWEPGENYPRYRPHYE